MKLSALIVGTLVGTTALGANNALVRRGTEQVSAARQEVTQAIRELNSGANVYEISQKLVIVQRRLVAAERTLTESLLPNNPVTPVDPDYPEYPTDPLPPARVQMSAKCEIDDDPDFTPGQMSGGVLRGGSVGQLLADCEAIAQANGSRQYSFGISDIKVLQKPDRFVQATCEIDDDPDFTAGQSLAGEIAGTDFLNVLQQCKQIAKSTYKTNGSAGIKNPKIDVTRYRVSADCHLDDDPDFTEGQVVFGKMGGASVAEVVAQCSGLAREIYGTNGSSGLRNVVQR